ncbi:MAG: hypothetical protein JWM34_4782 [Ilumatobacteraceae bacterium]|nr:hypothetical protein [Ilumatobacteraceae bacterium]
MSRPLHPVEGLRPSVVPLSLSLPEIVVGVPACNEEQLVERSIRSILAAADAVASRATVRVVVACDDCVDETVAIVARMAVADDRLDVIVGTWRSAGACRSAAIEAGLQFAGLARHDDANVWIATTDADTVVPEDWLVEHLGSWAVGDHAIAGIVQLLADDALTAAVATSFRANYAVGADTHSHVHGANLGVRADAYRSVGGFPSITLSEDHALWRALLAAGFRCRSSVALWVSTSGRLVSRAPGGFADTLAGALGAAGVAEAEGFCA